MTDKEREEWRRYDEMVSCYETTGEYGRPETVHERRSDGSCKCGYYTPKEK